MDQTNSIEFNPQTMKDSLQLIIKQIDEDEKPLAPEGIDFEWTPVMLKEKDLTLQVTFDDPTSLAQGFEDSYEFVLIFWKP